MKLNKITFRFLFLLFFISNLVYAQTDLEEYNNNLFGKDKIEVLIQKSKSFLNASSEQVRINALDALNIASANHDTSYISLSYCYLGASYVMEKNYDTAYYLLALAEKFALSSADKEPLVRVYNNIATIHEEMKNYQKSFEYYYKANEVIINNDLNHLYMPQLSLSKFYCRNNNWEKANELLELIKRNSSKNNDLYINSLARINQLALLLAHNNIDADLAEEELKIILNLLDDNNIVKLKKHINEVKIQLFMAKNDWIEAQKLVSAFQENDIEECKLKIKHYIRIAKFYQNSGYSEAAINTYNIIQILNDKILALYDKNIESATNDRFELANQKIIIDQIKNDKQAEELKFRKTNIYLNVSLLINIFLIVILIIIVAKYGVLDSKKVVSQNSESFNFSNSVSFESLLNEFEYMPAFLLNEKLLYEDANDLFYNLLNKKPDNSIRGCNDYDLPWKENSKQLWENYNSIKQSNRALILKKDLFICGCDIILLPLNKNNKFRGVLGLLRDYKVSENEKTDPIKTKNQMEEQSIKKKILLVDDEEDNLILINKYLSKYNCSVSTCTNGNEALKLLNEDEFNYVLMDLEMPKKNGYETIQEIRINQLNPNCQYFAVTAHSRNELKTPEIDMFDDLITKPIVKDILVNKLNLSLKDRS